MVESREEINLQEKREAIEFSQSVIYRQSDGAVDVCEVRIPLHIVISVIRHHQSCRQER
jgi:hypothetical protein